MPINLDNADDLLVNIEMDELCNWNLFDLDFDLNDISLPSILPDTELFDSQPWNKVEPSEYVFNHDCMWTGHCGSKDHPSDEFVKPLIKPIVPPVIETPVTKQSVVPGRSLLLRTAMKPTTPAAPVQGASPDSPPISDDEDGKRGTTTLQMLNDAIKECDIDEDSDLCEYFEEGEDLLETMQEQQQTQQQQPHHHHYHQQQAQLNQIRSRESDHSYHKDKNASMHRISSNLGIETPSDSGKCRPLILVIGILKVLHAF